MKSHSMSAAWQIFQRAKSAATENNVAVQVEMLHDSIKKKKAGEADMSHVFLRKSIIKNMKSLFSSFQIRPKKYYIFNFLRKKHCYMH